jgi:plastocyanin
VLLAALSTGHKLGLGLVGLAFVVFALVSAFLIPALRPDYPSRRGLPAFLTLTVALFVGMMFAVFFFGREPSESRAQGGSTAAGSTAPSTAAPAPTTTPSSTASTTTQTTTPTPSASVPTTPPTAPKSVPVTESEFKIVLPSESLSAGSYTFDLTNKGAISHDLVVNGPGVSNEKTPLIGPRKTAQLTVDLKSGTYDLYCSVPGHKQAGMDLKLKVS